MSKEKKPKTTKHKKAVKKESLESILKKDTKEVKTTRKPMAIPKVVWNTLGEFLSKDNLKYALNGIHFTEDSAVAIDGRRMAILENINVPKFLVDKTIEFRKAKLDRKATNDCVVLKRDGAKRISVFDGFSTQLAEFIDGKFPNYKMFMPKVEDKVAIERIKLNFILMPKNYHGALNFYGALKPVHVTNLFNTQDIDADMAGFSFIFMPMKED